jgi:HNH endonuclease
MKYEIKHKESILWAMNKYDRIGRDRFLREYRYGRARKYLVVHPDDSGRLYDSKIIAAAAIGHENPAKGWPKAKGYGFSGGDQMAKPLLEAHGFKVIDKAAGLVQVGDELEELRRLTKNLENEGYFDAANERQRTLREIVERRGQPSFRRTLIEEHQGRCVITGCDAVSALEAAHIMAFSDLGSDKVSNGLLLRADIHTLFDLDLIRIDPDSMKVVLAPKLRGTCYKEFEGRQLSIPAKREALTQRWKRSKH